MNDITVIERANSRYTMSSVGKAQCSTPLYVIQSLSTGETLHVGKRKHIVEMWNTRYNYSRSRSYSAS